MGKPNSIESAPTAAYQPSTKFRTRSSNVKVWRPTLRVKVSNGEHGIESFGVVDSGSDFTCLPTWTAEPLGVTLANPVVTTGVGGKNVTYFYPVTIQFPDIDGAPLFAVNAAFVDGLNEWV